jgi:hypothetical protein
MVIALTDCNSEFLFAREQISDPLCRSQPEQLTASRTCHGLSCIVSSAAPNPCPSLLKNTSIRKSKNLMKRLHRGSCFAALTLLLLLFLYPPAAAIDRAHYQELTKELRERTKQKDWQGAFIEAHLGHKAKRLTGCRDSPPPA